MGKKFTIEVPMYSYSLDHLIELNQSEDISIVIYGGWPDSPLNGGRFNYALDGLFFWDRLLLRLTHKQRLSMVSRFQETVARANQHGIPFFLAYTNMLVSRDELNEGNLSPVRWLVDSGRRHEVKNGVIVNNALLEDQLRQQYKDQLVFVSSCTKYVMPDRIMAPAETLRMYLADSSRYDYVVVTPQDSRREKLLKDVLAANQKGIVAICNSYCANNCNSYDHYLWTSKENKKSLVSFGVMDFFRFVNSAFFFLIPRAPRCPAIKHIVSVVDVRKIAAMQLKSGVVNFKFGRGFGADFLDQLVELIAEFNKTGKPA